MNCSVCGKPVPPEDREEGRYAVVWDPPRISFAHLQCAEAPQFKDVTAEISGAAS